MLRRHLASATVAAVLLVGCGDSASTTSGPGAGDSPAPTSSTTPSTTTTTTSTAPGSPTVPGPTTTLPTTTTTEVEFPTGIVPTRLEIPAIGVDATNIRLDLRGPEPEVPSNFAETGWYEQTRLPGEIGPAVIAGHIDSTEGAAVFARLDELVEGDEIILHGDDGMRRRFVVTGAGQYPKEDLPDEVFGFGDAVPELRLITCGGTFDRSAGHYRDNYVVYSQETA